MKNKNIIYFLILVCVTFAALYVLAALVRKATFSPDRYDFVYYGSVLKKFGVMDYQNKEHPMTDVDGVVYTAAEFDSLMPLLNFRQLMSDGRLPDSLGGYELTPALVRTTQVVYRFSPKDILAPSRGLNVLLESMPKRGGLEIPNDVFRLKNGIEFIDATTNTVNRAKSDAFCRTMDKAGFQFPAQWAYGNPSVRKSYDEGYFSLDADGNLFHLKMVNGRAFVKNTRLGETIDILHFAVYEAANKRFYGFLFDRGGGVYIVESDEIGGYEAVRLEIGHINPLKDEIMVMGNLLYWTVSVTNGEGRRYYALDAQTLKCEDTYFIERTPNRWDKFSSWLFPAYLSFEHPDTAYIMPRITFTGWHALTANIVAALLVLLLARCCRRKKGLFTLYVLITGLAGLLAVAVLPGFRQKL